MYSEPSKTCLPVNKLQAKKRSINVPTVPDQVVEWLWMPSPFYGHFTRLPTKIAFDYLEGDDPYVFLTQLFGQTVTPGIISHHGPGEIKSIHLSGRAFQKHTSGHLRSV